MDGRFPEVEAAAAALPDGVVLDGELLAWLPEDKRPLPFARLQRRIGRQKPSKRILTDHPVRFLAYDVLEAESVDCRDESLLARRARLRELVAPTEPAIALSTFVDAGGWDDLAERREYAGALGTEGFVLKRAESPYRVGRVRGDWWKWKIDPYAVDAVLIYAQPGHGRRSNLLTDYTFAVWSEDGLVPFAKAYSGLTDAELNKLDRWIRQNTVERFGPVRSVTPAHVFELHFEGIQASNRHKSGVAVRFPRIARWRDDKPIAEADTLTGIKALLSAREVAG